jgi:hypothetical protein
MVLSAFESTPTRLYRRPTQTRCSETFMLCHHEAFQHKHVRLFHGASSDDLTGVSSQTRKKAVQGTQGDREGAFGGSAGGPGTEDRFSCSVYAKTSTRRVNQVDRTRSHYGERQHGCESCHKQSTRGNHLERHKRLHLRTSGTDNPLKPESLRTMGDGMADSS